MFLSLSLFVRRRCSRSCSPSLIQIVLHVEVQQLRNVGRGTGELQVRSAGRRGRFQPVEPDVVQILRNHVAEIQLHQLVAADVRLLTEGDRRTADEAVGATIAQHHPGAVGRRRDAVDAGVGAATRYQSGLRRRRLAVGRNAVERAGLLHLAAVGKLINRVERVQLAVEG